MDVSVPPSAPGSVPHTVGPPMRRNATWLPGATEGNEMRLTATVRPVVTARLVDDDAGLPPQHPYVRMFWIPLLGPGAVADLLRLTAAARCGRPLRLPTHLTTLVTEGLVALGRDRTLIVRSTVPRLRVDQIRRLPPEVRRRHLMVR